MKRFWCSACVFAAVAALPIEAQESAPAPPQGAAAETGSDGIEVIRVTISKREESLQEIPASVSAFTGELLEHADLENVSDLATLVPGFIAKGEGRTGAISIRGISESFTGQASVARHINGVFQRDGSLGYTGQYYDLKSIEVSRGPAGTVYGRNATAGAVNVIWNPPHAEWEVAGDATLGNFDRKQLRAIVNVPFFGPGDERLMGRFSLQRELRDGYLDNDFQNEHDDVQNMDEFYARGALRSVPTENLSIELRGYWTHSDANTNLFRPLTDTYTVGTLTLGSVVAPFDWAGGLVQFKSALLADPNFGLIALINQFNESHPSLDASIQDVLLTGFPGAGPIPPIPALIPSPTSFTPALPIHENPLRTRSRLIQNAQRRPDLKIYAGDGQLEWSVGDFSWIGAVDFKIIGGYQFLEIHQLSDADGTELVVIDSIQHHTRHSYTVDAQVVTKGEALPLDLILGFFYFRNTDDRPNQHALTPLGDFPSREYREITGWAPYLSATARLLEVFSDDPLLKVELFAGVRWNRDEEYLDQLNVETPLRGEGKLDDSVTFKEWTWEAGLRWFVSDAHMLYAKYAKGYKPGLQQLDLSALPKPVPVPVGPEIIRAWEVGWKAGWWDNQLTTALTGFYYDYSDLQVAQLINNQTFTQNAAKATNWGVELELTARPTDAWMIQGNVGYLNARFDEFCSDDPAVNTSFDAPACAGKRKSTLNAINGLIGLSGNDLEDAPAWKLSLLTSYAIELGRFGTLTPIAKLTWTDDYFLRPFNLAIDEVDSYTRTDVRLRWDSPEARYSVEAFVDNVEDEVVFARTIVGPDFTGGFPASVGVLQPRMYGVRVGFKWGGE